MFWTPAVEVTREYPRLFGERNRQKIPPAWTAEFLITYTIPPAHGREQKLGAAFDAFKQMDIITNLQIQFALHVYRPPRHFPRSQKLMLCKPTHPRSLQLASKLSVFLVRIASLGIMSRGSDKG
jgi:hypothetical protein